MKLGYPRRCRTTCSGRAADRAMASMRLVGKGDLNLDDARQAGRSQFERTDTVLEGKRVGQERIEVDLSRCNQVDDPIEYVGVTKDRLDPHLLGDRGRNIEPHRADR